MQVATPAIAPQVPNHFLTWNVCTLARHRCPDDGGPTDAHDQDVGGRLPNVQEGVVVVLTKDPAEMVYL